MIFRQENLGSSETEGTLGFFFVFFFGKTDKKSQKSQVTKKCHTSKFGNDPKDKAFSG